MKSDFPHRNCFQQAEHVYQSDCYGHHSTPVRVDQGGSSRSEEAPSLRGSGGARDAVSSISLSVHLGFHPSDAQLNAESPIHSIHVPQARDRLGHMATDTFDPHLSPDDFRAKRNYLPAEAFALVKGPYEGMTDLIPEDQWQGLMSGPTDVLLRTTDQHGRQLAQLHDLWDTWVQTLPPQEDEAPFVFNAGWDAADDFNASAFNAAHGYYRQGMASLRSALEGMALAARFSLRQEPDRFLSWVSGEPQNFGNARDLIKPILGDAITDVLRRLHRDLSAYIHSGPGGSNATLWDGSNGPVFERDSFVKVYRYYRDVMAMAYILLTLGWTAFDVPDNILPLFETPGGLWEGEPLADVKENFMPAR